MDELDPSVSDPADLRPTPTVQDLLETDSRDVPDVLRDAAPTDVAQDPVPKERYLDPDWLALEYDHVWSRVWQMACREEDIPDPGDYHLYEIGDTSVIVVRQRDETIRAHINVCLHRGRRLCDENGRAVHFRCPFHAFTWNLNGSCKKITNGWDFDHVDKETFSLPSVHVERWNGFVFVNLSDTPPPFRDYLEGLDRDMATRGWDLGERRKVVYVRKHYPANWKVVLEAFIESFHVVATHPTAMNFIGDANTQYDVWPDRRHVTRMISPRGIHSPHVPKMSETAVYRAGIRPTDPEGYKTAELPEGQNARQATAENRRQFLKEMMGIDVDHLSDSELIDTIQYHLFPNLVFWAGIGSFLVYRFLPDGDDPDRCFMDIMFLVPESEDAPRQVAVEPTVVEIGESHHKAPQLGGYCDVFDEDKANVGQVQKGLKSMRGPGPVFGSYQEARIRRFHQTLGEYVAAGQGRAGAGAGAGAAGA
ncbi:MAG: aromatic ring-hydroxylating dioxygenase subunit alpha [Pseudomonadota bacterium]